MAAAGAAAQHELYIVARQHATPSAHPPGAGYVGSFPLSPTRQPQPGFYRGFARAAASTETRRRDVDPHHPPEINTDGRRKNTLVWKRIDRRLS